MTLITIDKSFVIASLKSAVKITEPENNVNNLVHCLDNDDSEKILTGKITCYL